MPNFHSVLITFGYRKIHSSLYRHPDGTIVTLTATKAILLQPNSSVPLICHFPVSK